MHERIELTAIGIIHSIFKNTVGIPIQPSLSQGESGTVEVFPQYKDGLRSLNGFSHIYLIYFFHLSHGYSLTVKPFLDDSSHGIFSTRAPKRPNGIGISVVELTKIKNNILYVKNIDIVDGTPLIDIKPYVSKFDCYTTTREGWLSKKTNDLNEHYSDERFEK